MLTIAYYFAQVILCSGLLMGYYLLVLRNKRFHQYNRFYLLAVAVLSWIVPLIKIRWTHPVVSQDPQVFQLLSVVADNNTQIENNIITKQEFQWSGYTIAAGVYFLVGAVLLIAMLLAFYRIYRLLKQHSCKNVEDVYLVLTKVNGTPFSFFRYIFWNEEIDLRSESGKQILQHEITHVRQKHSFDKIFIRVMLVPGWFNPCFWLLKKEMEMIHEFIADKKAVNNGDTASLAQMLLTAAYPQQKFAMTNPFFFSPIRRRLRMLANTANPRFSYMRRTIILPLLAIVVILFSFRTKEKRENLTLSVASVMENMVSAVTNNDAGSPKEIMVPEIGAPDKKYTVLIDAGRGGNDKGTVAAGDSTAESLLTLQVAKKIKELNSNEHINIVLPQEREVSQSATDTVIIKEKAGGHGVVIKTGDTSVIQQFRPLTAQTAPLIIIDGVRSDFGAMESIDMGSVAEVSVIKVDAMKLYGEDARNGVIVITTKNYAAKIKKNTYSRWVADTGMIKGKDIYTDKPLYFINGVKMGPAETIDPHSITAIRVLKDAAAIVKYGEEAKEGVIEVTTKSMTQGGKSFRLPEQYYTRGYPMGSVVNIRRLDIPDFPGGQAAWRKYLERNMDKDLIERKGGPPGKYTVIVSFTVSEKGKISNVRADNDPGYGAKQEAERLINKRPNWIPAIKDGKAVTSDYKQSITFYVADVKMQ